MEWVVIQKLISWTIKDHHFPLFFRNMVICGKCFHIIGRDIWIFSTYHDCYVQEDSIIKKEKNRKSIIVIAASIGLTLLAILESIDGNPSLLFAIVVFITILVLDKYFITPFQWREKLANILGRYQKPINYILFSIFIVLIVLIVFNRYF